MRGDLEDLLDDGVSVAEAERRVLAGFPGITVVGYEWTDFWVALALTEHDRGVLTDRARDAALANIDAGGDLELWAESGSELRDERAEVLAAARRTLTSAPAPNPVPGPAPTPDPDPTPGPEDAPRAQRNAPSSRPLPLGEVLALQTASGRWHCLVVTGFTPRKRQSDPPYEMLGLLKYHDYAKPTLDGIRGIELHAFGQPRPPDMTMPAWGFSRFSLQPDDDGLGVDDVGIDRLGVLRRVPAGQSDEWRYTPNVWSDLRSSIDRYDKRGLGRPLD